ncbi:hypothetical protein NQ318_012892 [Aromia moschata]|uniref:Post-SET domain-containing protein n=1 Tax=Aromia moschata TaxID=1265417 RepID=A0AAV8YF72_9CUCU|nr:hypothetical protein NQ318_012892 [Aromia moschata]
MRRILSGEELTYDYKFPFEEDKIPCTCGSIECMCNFFFPRVAPTVAIKVYNILKINRSSITMITRVGRSCRKTVACAVLAIVFSRFTRPSGLLAY